MVVHTITKTRSAFIVGSLLNVFKIRINMAARGERSPLPSRSLRMTSHLATSYRAHLADSSKPFTHRYHVHLFRVCVFFAT